MFNSSLTKRLLGAALISTALLGFAGCSKSENAPATAQEVNAFNGAGGKMPADFQAKMEAAKQNGQAAQQQAAQKAAQQPKPAAQ